MTEQGSQQGLTISRSEWLHYAGDLAERWLTAGGKPAPEMARFGSYIRELRYGSGHRLSELVRVLRVPHETLVLLEQGLLKPSEINSAAWVKLMRMIEGREAAPQQPVSNRQDEAPSASARSEPEPPEPTREVEDVPEAAGPTPRFAPQGSTMQQHQPIGVARIKVIGIGGGGSNAVARMYRQRIPGIEYVAVNTDAQHLLHIDVPEKIRIGDRLTRGLGVGGDPEVGREAAEESREELHDMIAGTDMVFIACGMGGGTGTGAAPVIAQIAKEAGVLTIAAVTRPFVFEGRKRAVQAEEGVHRLRPNVDTLILIPNDRLSEVSDEQMTAENAFRIADDVLRQGVQSIAELVTVPGEINLDFADVRTVMSGAGPAWMAIGTGRGEDRAAEAARNAMASPLLDAPIEGATRVLLNITGGTDLTLQEVQKAADFVGRLVDPDANIIFGMVTDPKMEEEVRVTVIATGLEDGEETFETSLEEMMEQSMDDEEEEDPSEPPVELPGFLRRFGFGRRKP